MTYVVRWTFPDGRECAPTYFKKKKWADHLAKQLAKDPTIPPASIRVEEVQS